MVFSDFDDTVDVKVSKGAGLEVHNIMLQKICTTTKTVYRGVGADRRIEVALRRPFFSQVAGWFGGQSKQERKDAAARDIKDAVRVLSKGAPRSMPSPGPGRGSAALTTPVPTLQEWNRASAVNLSTLKTEQLEELARANFEGSLVSEGEELQPNKSRAVEIWQLLIKRDAAHLEALYSLAACLRTGEGTAKDPVRAFSMMRALADDHDYFLAHYAVGIMYSTGEGCGGGDSSNSGSKRIGKGRNAGKKGGKNGAIDGNNDAHDKKAFEHFRAAAKEGVEPALFNIANALAAGRGVTQSDANAAKYYEAAAEAGDPAAKFTLGTWIVQGRGGLKIDAKKAFDLQCEAGQAGHPGAAYNAACHLMTGQGCEANVPLAAEWFQTAADKGIPEAAINLGNLYRAGNGVTRSLIKARNLYARHAMTHQVSRDMLNAVNAEIKAEEAGFSSG